MPRPRPHQQRLPIGTGHAAIYARVSTDEQAESGLGVDAQIAAFRQLVEMRGWQIAPAHVFIDAGVSGTTPPDQRPAMARLLAAAADGQIAHVAIYSLDRLARKTRYILEFTEQAASTGLGVAFVREAAVDTTTAAGRVVLSVIAAFAQFERDLISERTSAALAAKRATGWKPGRLPLGYISGDDGAISVHPANARTARRILAEREAGASYRAIADGLHDDGIAAPYGRRWYASSVRAIYLENANVYAGEVPGFPPLEEPAADG